MNDVGAPKSEKELRARAWPFFFMAVILVCVVGFLYYAVRANTDLSAQVFALFMDERITFVGVKRILNPIDVQDFLFRVFDGVDQRYGRILWNSMAAFTVVPSLLFGDAGQIIAGRMFHAILIIVATLVFAFGLLRRWELRAVLVVALLALPYSSYFATMPKPEPVQLFLLSIFCVLFFRAGMRFGPYWVLIGLAFGAKISTLPALLVFLCGTTYAHLYVARSPTFMRDMGVAGVWFVIGLGLAVPILLTAIVPALVLACLGYFLAASLKFEATPRFALAAAGAIAGVWLGRVNITRWLSATFGNTGHGSDQAGINFWNWTEYFFDEWMSAPPALGVLLVSSIAVFMVIRFVRLISIGRDANDREIVGITIALAGLALNAAIFLGVNRLWGFYLFPGMALILVGFIKQVEDQWRAASLEKRNGIDLLALAPLLLLCATAVFFWAPTVVQQFETEAKRTETEHYKIQLADYTEVTNFLRELPARRSPIIVRYRAAMFLPETTEKYRILPFYGPFTWWERSGDVIVFNRNSASGGKMSVDSPNYKKSLVADQTYKEHVTDRGGACMKSPCYERARRLPGGGEILVRKSLE